MQVSLLDTNKPQGNLQGIPSWPPTDPFVSREAQQWHFTVQDPRWSPHPIVPMRVYSAPLGVAWRGIRVVFS